MPDIITYQEKDADAVAHKAFGMVTAAAAEAISKRGRFVFSLAGGNTPKKLYALLKDFTTDWHQWLLVYGDERCLPLHHPERNSSLVQDTWLDNVNFPDRNHFIIHAESGAQDAANTYRHTLTSILPIDFALLGIGEDGHTASLFPKNMTANAASNDSVLAILDSPKPPKERVSLSYDTLNTARIICFMATGPSKQAILKNWQHDITLPFNRIHGTDKTLLLTDTEAFIPKM